MDKKISVFGSNHVMLSNGQGLPITSIGATSFHSLHNPHTTLTLKYLLLVPNIYCQDNYVFFPPDICLVKSQITSKTLLQGSLGKDELYAFDQI
jgi:hypothetical protein